MSAYNDSNSSTERHMPSTTAFNNLVSSPASSRSERETDGGNHGYRGFRIGTNSTCPETNRARYAESLAIPIRGSAEEIDHSAGISKDIGIFLNDSKLSDYTIKVKKTLNQVSSQAIFVSDSLAPYEEKDDPNYETFKVHKIILAARCPYYNTLFCSVGWKEANKDINESKFDYFDPEWMRIFLQYVYTGKLQIQLRTLIGVLKIASYFTMSIIMDSWKSILDSDYFTALDLCQLYKEVSCTNDFDSMISFLSDLIPKKTSNDSICRILREIWTEEDPEDSDEECIPNMKDDCRSLRIRSSKSELIVKHAGSLKAEVMTELLSASDDRSVNEDDEEDLPHKILRKIQNSLPELYENDNVVEDLIRLPKSALVKIFKSDRSCASEKMFFNILDRIAELESPVPKLNPISLCRMNKSSIDGTQNEYADIAINELEEEKLEEEEEDESEQKEEEEESEQEEEEEKEEPNKTSRKKKKIHFNETSVEFQSDMEEEEKSLKLETISERTQSVCREHSKRWIKDLIPHIRLALISRSELITVIRESRYFSDDDIFEALIYQDVPEKIGNLQQKKFRRRGVKVEFDYCHPDIATSHENRQGKSSILLKRIQKSDNCENKYVTATHSDPLPLHGIHYFEVKLHPSQNANVTSKAFIGLWNPSDGNNLEDTFKDKNALMFYTYNCSFWSSGTQLSSLLSRSNRLKYTLDSGDILRIAIDFRQARSFQPFWKEMDENTSQNNEQRNIFPQPQNASIFNRNLQNQINSNEEHGIRFRSRDNLSLFLGSENEPIFFSSPCKLYYAINNSEMSDGVDINLMSIDSAPIHFAISLCELNQQVESSRWVYFDSMEHIPKKPFLLDPEEDPISQEGNIRESEISNSNSHLNIVNASEPVNSA